MKLNDIKFKLFVQNLKNINKYVQKSEKSKNFHLKLEHLIREVDKCIGLLDN